MAKNPTPTPGEMRRDVGSGEQLGAGEATALNEDLAAGDAAEEQIAANAIDVGDPQPSLGAVQDVPEVEFDDTDGPVYRPAGEDEEFLFAPPEGDKFDHRKQDERPLPTSLIRALPRIAAVVNNPATPPALKAAYRLILERYAKEQELRYR